MVPTGSMFVRSWRTRWHARLRLVAVCAVACGVMLAAVSAHADWRTASMPGKPNDVLDVWAPGNFSVGYSNGAHLFLDGGLARSIDGGTGDFESAGTFYDEDAGCFVSVNRGTGVGGRSSKDRDGGSCADPSNISPQDAPVVRVRHAAGGGAAALASLESSSFQEVSFSRTNIYAPGPFLQSALLASYGLNGSFAVQRVGDTIYALAGISASNGTFYLYRLDDNSQDVIAIANEGDPAWGTVQSADVFAAGNPGPLLPYAVVGTRRGFLQGILPGAGPNEPRMVQQLEPGAEVKSVDLNVQSGSPYGYGFGMALVSLPDGGFTVARSVPMLNDTQAGTRWLFRALPATFPKKPLKQVACVGASYCVITVDELNTSNLFLYTNDAGPQLTVQYSDGGVTLPTDGGLVPLSEGQSIEFALQASDPEGDPVLVTVDPTSTPQWSVTQANGGMGDPLLVTLTGGTVCRDEQVGSFMAHASDGLASHDLHRAIPVLVRNTRPPTVPQVMVSESLVAGGRDVVLSVSELSPEGCRLSGHQWRVAPGAPAGLPGPALVQQDGGTAVLRPPTTLCAAQGGDFPFELQVKDETGLSSLASFNVHVEPWGTPNVAFGAGADAGMIAGETRVFMPTESPHACLGTSGFPGVETLWTVEGGVPAGVTLLTADTRQQVSTFPVQAPGLIVETKDCINNQWVLSAVNRTLGGSSSAPSVMPVRVQTALTSLAQSTLQLNPQKLPENKLRVTVGTANLNCPELRPGLKAELRFGPVNADGGMEPEESSTVDLASGQGQWSDFPLGVGCEGGHFRVEGSLVDDAGVRSAVATEDVTTEKLDVALQPLAGEPTLAASCEGARATLTQTFPAGACQTPDVTTWEQVFGPELTQLSHDGGTVSLATQETRLELLVGQSVVMRVTASASGDNQASIEHTLPITVEPFVRVRRRAEVPAASDTELVGVSVELINTLTCGVGNVDYVERMRGLTYVAGSAQFNGIPVEASWEEGALSVKGLSLGGSATGRLTYVARPHLLGERRMDGEARLNGAIISISRQPGLGVPDSGCGCTSSGPGPVLFALGALVAAVRRRRR